AHRTRISGREAIEKLERSRRWMSGDISSSDDAEEREPMHVDAPRVRVDDAAASRAGVDADEEQIEEQAPSKRASKDR
ncbi:MAG: hypothetical protein ABI183_19570, partial [Polyangiaceae bacterium]